MSATKTMSIKECISCCENKRVENSKAYRESVRKSNEMLRNYELQQACMYKKAAEYCVK